MVFLSNSLNYFFNSDPIVTVNGGVTVNAIICMYILL